MSKSAKSNGSLSRKVRMVVAGPGAVGKSSLTIQYVMNSFVEYYDPTIEDSYRKQIVIDEHAYLLDILDTAGQEEYMVLQDEWFRSGQCFVLVYSIANLKTFQELHKIKQRIMTAQDKDHVPMVLVGNMSDLEKERQVTTSEGKELAKLWGCSFIETSALHGTNIHDAFAMSVREHVKAETASISRNEKPTKRVPKNCLIL
eukprot:TRINITY_DN11113_c0_g1_i1.p1 TRINITY_DN11113_c0_g1~~TRINITY_DN11113_c0_g1_i1.p1  ORF type:complete len:201 (-),score=46.76 TRINITY_DN11113_c0_g1_i1:305-907(-)